MRMTLEMYSTNLNELPAGLPVLQDYICISWPVNELYTGHLFRPNGYSRLLLIALITYSAYLYLVQSTVQANLYSKTIFSLSLLIIIIID